MATILVLSYDLKGRVHRDPALWEQKLRRDGITEHDTVQMISWSDENASTSPSLTRWIETRRPALSFKPLNDLLLITRASRIAEEKGWKPDRIVVAEFPLLFAAQSLKRRVGGTIELHLNNLPTDLAKTRGPLHRLYSVLFEWLTIAIPDRFVVINETTRRYLLARGVPEARIVVRVPDTITHEQTLRARAVRGSVRREYGIASETPILLSVGRLEREKGFTELFDLFARIPEPAILMIVGDGALKQELEMHAAQLGIKDRVIFAGAQDRAHIWNYYADADAFVLLSESEALGLVIWEAMSMRLPVMGRAVGGIAESIGTDGERGFLWRREEGVEAFREKLARCFTRDEHVRAMIERASRFVEERLMRRA